MFPKYWCRTILIGSRMSLDFPESINDYCKVGDYQKNFLDLLASKKYKM